MVRLRPYHLFWWLQGTSVFLAIIPCPRSTLVLLEVPTNVPQSLHLINSLEYR